MKVKVVHGVSLTESSWLLSQSPVARSLAWLSRKGFPPARWFGLWKMQQEVRAWQRRVEADHRYAVLSAAVETGRPVVGITDEDGTMVVEVMDSEEWKAQVRAGNGSD